MYFLYSLEFNADLLSEEYCVYGTESCLIMVGPSTSHALTEVEQMIVLNELLDDKTLSNYSSDDDSASRL
jgi:hypothetical protein